MSSNKTPVIDTIFSLTKRLYYCYRCMIDHACCSSKHVTIDDFATVSATTTITMATPTSPPLPSGSSPSKHPPSMDLSKEMKVTPAPPPVTSPSIMKSYIDPMGDTKACIPTQSPQPNACPPRFSLKDYHGIVGKYKDKLVALSTTADLNLPALVKVAEKRNERELTELLSKMMKLANAYKNTSTRRKQMLEEYVAYLKHTDLATLRANAIELDQENLHQLLSDISDVKNVYENNYNSILRLAMKTLKHYEEETIACLRNPSLLETLIEDAHRAKLIPEKVRNIFASLDCNVSHSLKCRYLILHVNKKIANNLDSFDLWLSLLYKHEGIHSLLEIAKVHYELLRTSSRVEQLTYFKKKHVSNLTEIISNVAHSMYHYKKIAIYLDLPHDLIIAIQSEVDCLRLVLDAWITQKYDCAKPNTLENLQSALSKLSLPLRPPTLESALSRLKGLKTTSAVCRILDQCPSIKIHEGSHCLLEMVVSSVPEASLSYQWYKDGGKLNDAEQDHNCYGSEDCIINIFATSLIVESSYTCRIQQGDHVITSEPIVLTVETPLDKYTKKLTDFYTAKPEVPEDTWPPVSIDTYINLALIKQQDIDTAGEYARSTIRGDADDVFKDKESIEYKNVFDRLGSGARLLIEGRPGSGKTTLVHKVSKDWAKNELKFDRVRLLFLVHLRGFFSDPNIELRDILECFFSKSDSALDGIVNYADTHNGLGLCFILDGLDEYLPKKKDTYIHRLINKSQLPRAVVIVASRPAAVADFRTIATRQIEVLGFLKEQISEYIKEYNFADESKCSEVLKYLDHHPNVHHMCYLPIHTAMVCFLRRIGRNLPETETGIYKEFTIYFFLRALRQLNDDEDIYLESIESLPSSERESYMKICKLAFEMTESSKQVMKQKDVQDFFSVHSNRDYLGLITVDRAALKYGFQKLYTFLHLTFQEFLTAYHISKLEEEEQTKLVDKYRNAKYMQTVWKFYCGLVKFDDCNKFRSLVDSTQTGTLHKVQCSFESQQSGTCDSIVKDGSLSFKDKILTPSDFTAIAFVISHVSQGISKLVFDECTLGQEGIDVLSEKAKDKLSLVTTLCFHGHNCAAEQLKAVNRLMHAQPSLQILDLTGTQLGEDAVRALTSDLNHSNLQVLKIDTSDSNPLYSSNELLQRLVKSFTKCSSFVNIWFPDYSKKHLLSSLSLPFYLCSNIHLPDINMSCHNLQPVEIDLLSNEFKVRCICSRLSLINCGITDEGAKTLSDAIRCSNIKILELSMNSIGNEGAQAFAKSIESCLILQTVDLSCNQIGDGGALAIVRAIPVKTCDLFLWSNNITRHGAETLLQIKQDIDLKTFYIDSRNIGDNGAADIAKNVRGDSLHSLKLCCNFIGSAGAKALANALKKCKGLSSLDLSSNMIGWNGVKALGDALSVCTSLTSLNLSGNSINDSGAVAIANGLKKLSLLELINISNNSIGKHGIKALTDAFKVHTNLTSLNLSGNSIGNDGAKALADVLKKLKLTTLNLSSNKINTNGAEALSTMLHKKKYSDFHALSLGHNSIGQRGAIVLADALKNCTSLHTIDICDICIDSKGAMALAGVLRHSRNLHTLDIAQNHLKNEGIMTLADVIKNCNKLYKLNIADNNIDDHGIKAIANALKKCSNLHMLDVSHNHMGKSGAMALASSIKCWVELQVLDLSYNNLGRDGIEDLADTIECCSNLHTLNVAQLSDDGSVKALADAIKGCCELHALNISNNGIKAQDMEPLADAIKQCSKMHTLDISHNNLRNNGAKTLCSALKDCSNLHILDISFNDIGNDGAKALAGVIECCSNLHSLDISHNGIDKDGTKVIDDTTKYYSDFNLHSTPPNNGLWRLRPQPQSS